MDEAVPITIGKSTLILSHHPPVSATMVMLYAVVMRVQLLIVGARLLSSGNVSVTSLVPPAMTLNAWRADLIATDATIALPFARYVTLCFNCTKML